MSKSQTFEILSYNDRSTQPEPLRPISAFRVYNIGTPSSSFLPRLAISYTRPSSSTESFSTPPLTLPIPPSTFAPIDLTILARMCISRQCIKEGTRVSLRAVWEGEEVCAGEEFVVGLGDGERGAAEYVLVEGRLVLLRIDRERGREQTMIPTPVNRNVRTTSPATRRPPALEPTSAFVPVRQKNKRCDQKLDDDWEVLPRMVKRPRLVRRFSFVGLEDMMLGFPRV